MRQQLLKQKVRVRSLKAHKNSGLMQVQSTSLKKYAGKEVEVVITLVANTKPKTKKKKRR